MRDPCLFKRSKSPKISDKKQKNRRWQKVEEAREVVLVVRVKVELEEKVEGLELVQKAPPQEECSLNIRVQEFRKVASLPQHKAMS